MTPPTDPTPDEARLRELLEGAGLPWRAGENIVWRSAPGADIGIVRCYSDDATAGQRAALIAEGTSSLPSLLAALAELRRKYAELGQVVDHETRMRKSAEAEAGRLRGLLDDALTSLVAVAAHSTQSGIAGDAVETVARIRAALRGEVSGGE